MKKIKPISFFITLMLSINASSEELPIQMSGGMTFSAFDDNMGESEALGYKATVGYHINENVLFELGYADFSAFSDPAKDSLRAVMIETDILLPVSDFASLYTGLGGAISSDYTNFTASLGFKYQLNSNWYADFGYQGIFDLVSHNDDLYSFNALLVYRFTRSEATDSSLSINPRPIDEEVPAKVSTPQTQLVPIVPVEKTPLCTQHLVEYQVLAGDYLYKIAEEFNLSIDQLVDENKNLESRDLDLIYPGEKIVYPKIDCLE